MGDVKQHITMADRFRVYDAMRPVIVQHDDGTCEYIGKHSDSTIAKEFGLPYHVVQNTRLKGFGKLRDKKKMEKLSQEERIRRLEKQIAFLYSSLNVSIDDVA